MALQIILRTESAPFHAPDEAERTTTDYPDGNEPSGACRVEVARILRKIASAIEDGERTTHFVTIHDSNGTDVGRWKLLEEPGLTYCHDRGEEHEFGPMEHARFTGNPHRKCSKCPAVSLDFDEETEMEIITADGKTVHPGDRVFNYYDGKWGVIEDDVDHEGWFHHRAEDGSRRLLNGERVCVVIPPGNPFYGKA